MKVKEFESIESSISERMAIKRSLTLPNLEEHALPLAKIVASSGYLPDPQTVKELGGAVFPTVRNQAERLKPIVEAGKVVGMYDDNTTPRWALLWTHGYFQTNHPRGWTFAHVWHAAQDITAYTCLANLIMIPECFASLTDKLGPLTHFLRWHAWEVYGWKPEHFEEPTKPDHYEEISWQYLQGVQNPMFEVRTRLAVLNNQRSHVLGPLLNQKEYTT